VNDPIEKFETWWRMAKANSPLSQKSAVCLSTIDQSGYPSGRFVDLKSVSRDGFVFCTYLDSKKGREIELNNKVSMTMWWDHVGLQVRVVGNAKTLSEAEAERFWRTRNREAQITTTSCRQSQALADEADMLSFFEKTKHEYEGREVPKPQGWGGYIIEPVTIEFLTFNENRLHLRELFSALGENNEWTKVLLQP
jgi:pyridoxamine 5'-phosphate oxidase